MLNIINRELRNAPQNDFPAPYYKTWSERLLRSIEYAGMLPPTNESALKAMAMDDLTPEWEAEDTPEAAE